jgi:hypothetical protein
MPNTVTIIREYIIRRAFVKNRNQWASYLKDIDWVSPEEEHLYTIHQNKIIWTGTVSEACRYSSEIEAMNILKTIPEAEDCDIIICYTEFLLPDQKRKIGSYS